MISRVLILEGEDVQLQATDEGTVVLKLYGSYHTVANHGLWYMGGLSFIMAYAGEGSTSKIYYTVKLSVEPDVSSWFDYWDEGKLEELKNVKVKSFLSYLSYCLDFIKNNVDVEELKPTYETEYIDNTDYGGGISTYVYIYLKCGKDWEDNYRITSHLNKFLISQLIDRRISGEDEYYWFSNIIIQFRPLDDYKEDF